jgi:hypothetical protein
MGLGGSPAKTVQVEPALNEQALNFKPPRVASPSSQPTPAPAVTTPSSQPTLGPTVTPGTDGGASPQPSGRFGKALPATSGESSAGGFSAIWLLLVLGILALLFFLLFFLRRRKKEQEQQPPP